jgi:hypothetical protein
MITLHWNLFIFIPIAIVLLFLIIIPRESVYGNYSPYTSGFLNFAWLIVGIIFTLIWGGEFWW